MERSPNANILIVSHVSEIIEQDATKLSNYISKNIIGIYSAELKRREKRRICVASINSIYRRAKEFTKYDYIIIDEAHMIPPDGEGMYQTLLKHVDAPVVGLTATPFRLGHGYITDGHIFDKIVYDIDILYLIKEGYLSPVTSKQTDYQMDVTGVAEVAGDYNKYQLSKKIDKFTVTNKIVKELYKYRDLRKSWLIFAIDIEHAEHINQQLCDIGIRSAAIHSKLDVDRGTLIELFRAGLIQVLVSVETLTTGFDVPQVDMIVLMRPTQSAVLHIQMIGRGMRIFPGKRNCLVLDFAGNTKRLGPINAPYIRPKGERRKKGDANIERAKTCPVCKELLPLGTRVCECGHEFRTNTLDRNASKLDVIQEIKKKKPNKYKVQGVYYTKHQKAGKPSSLKVTYTCGLRKFHEWVGLEHSGFPRRKAESWWGYRAGSATPRTVEDALKRVGEIHTPLEIYVDETSKFPAIVRYTFEFER